MAVVWDQGADATTPTKKPDAKWGNAGIVGIARRMVVREKGIRLQRIYTVMVLVSAERRFIEVAPKYVAPDCIAWMENASPRGSNAAGWRRKPA